MARDIRLEVAYPHAPERVWQALTDGAPAFDDAVQGEVLRLDPPRLLSHTWRGGGVNTIVTYTLEPTGEGTRVHFSQAGFTGLRGAAVATILRRRWRTVLNQLHPPRAGTT
jgi:uncharacterized protein YndB with AHSA1/START domain